MPESATGTVVSDQEITNTTTEYVTRNRISATDPYLIERIVGYHEYGRALNYFDRLARRCDEYEMEAVDEIVRSEPEFAFYTVSGDQPKQRKAELTSKKRVENFRQDNNSRTTSEATYGSEKNRANTKNRKRHGFRWITALARVEVGAMRAGFSQHLRPYPKTPGYDADEYRSLLSESARLHFWSLVRDPIFMSLAKRFRPTSLTLSYMRRLNIATGFALASGIASNRNAPQKTMEMSGYAQRLNSARKAIQLNIAMYLATPEVNTQTQTSSRSGMLRLAELCNNGVCRQFDEN